MDNKVARNMNAARPSEARTKKDFLIV